MRARHACYEGRFAQFDKAIKAKYPNLKTIATMPLKRMKPDVQDDHYYRRAEEFFNFVNHYDTVDRNGLDVCHAGRARRSRNRMSRASVRSNAANCLMSSSTSRVS